MDTPIDLFSADLNIKELDEAPCALCGEVPLIKWIDRDSHGQYLPRKKQYMDRTSRIDCDAARNNEQSYPQTYHVKCWVMACQNYVSA